MRILTGQEREREREGERKTEGEKEREEEKKRERYGECQEDASKPKLAWSEQSC